MNNNAKVIRIIPASEVPIEITLRGTVRIDPMNINQGFVITVNDIASYIYYREIPEAEANKVKSLLAQQVKETK